MKDGVWWAVVPAAGLGSRFGSNVPKQYHTVLGVTLLDYVLRALLQFHLVERVVVALNENDVFWKNSHYVADPRVQTVVGGLTRHQSVLNAVKSLRSHAKADDWICVHDAARPGLTLDLLQRLHDGLSEHPVGGILAVPAVDTLKKVDAAGVIVSTLDRSAVWCAQTPQLFRYALLTQALEKVHQEGMVVTDEASAIEFLGYEAKVILGDAVNQKITMPSDLILFESQLKKGWQA